MMIIKRFLQLFSQKTLLQNSQNRGRCTSTGSEKQLQKNCNARVKQPKQGEVYFFFAKLSKTVSVKTLIIMLTGFLLSTSATAAQSAAQEVVIDRIAAIVNDDIVLLSEVRKVALRAKQSSQNNTSDKTLLKDALESLILQKVQLQYAKNSGIIVNDAALNTALLSIAKQNNLNLPQFKAALGKEGIDYKTFSESIRAKVYLENLRKHQQSSSEEINEVEIDDLIQSQSLRLNKDVHYHLIDILVPALNGSTSVQQFNRLLQQTHVLRKQLLTRSPKLASSDPIIKKMGATRADLGWKSSQSLSPAFVRALSLMGAGELSTVVRDQRGFHILKLVAQRGGERKIIQQARVRHILLPSTDPKAKLKITLLRNKILAGENFAALAKKNSADKGSAREGGNLAMMDTSSFVPPFAKAVNSLALNSLSQPIQTRFGWHIVEVLERKKSDQTREALKLQAQSVLSNEKKSDEFNNWLQGIRDQAFIEYRI